MTTRNIQKNEWKSFFDTLSKLKLLEKKKAEIEIISLQLGDQMLAKWMPLFGIVFDERSDTLEIGMEGLTHIIHRPKTIFSEEDNTELVSILILDENETQHIIRLSRL